MCRLSGLFNQFFPVQIDVFFSFSVRGSSVNSHKFHILLMLTAKNALKWLEWHIFRVPGMPNPMALVSILYDNWFLKNLNFQRQVSIKWELKTIKM